MSLLPSQQYTLHTHGSAPTLSPTDAINSNDSISDESEYNENRERDDATKSEYNESEDSEGDDVSESEYDENEESRGNDAIEIEYYENENVQQSEDIAVNTTGVRCRVPFKDRPWNFSFWGNDMKRKVDKENFVRFDKIYALPQGEPANRQDLTGYLVVGVEIRDKSAAGSRKSKSKGL